jgi:hypothetical protein
MRKTFIYITLLFSFYSNIAAASVCSRTQVVVDAILSELEDSYKLTNINCQQVTAKHLLKIESLHGIYSTDELNFGDFDGLYNLKELSLSDIRLERIDGEIFRHLKKLEYLS